MNNVVPFNLKAGEFADGVASGGGGGDNGDMEARITKLEAAAQEIRSSLVKIDSRLDHVEKTMATKDGVKAEISEAKLNIIMWLVGTVLTFGTTISAVVFFVARNVR